MVKNSCCTSMRICHQISSTHIESQPWFCTTVTCEDRKITEGCCPVNQANEEYGGDSTCVRGQGLSRICERLCLKGAGWTAMEKSQPVL